jgi:hypothetical protein
MRIAAELDLIASQLTKQGRLMEALGARQRREQINRALKNDAALAFDIPNRAELLIRLGRGQDAEGLLQEFEGKVRGHVSVFENRKNRVPMLRAMRAATEGRWRDVLKLANEVEMQSPTPDSATRLAGLLTDFARTFAGLSPAGTTPTQPAQSTSMTPAARELAYWEAQTSLATQGYRQAFDQARTVWHYPSANANDELRWRMAAIAVSASQYLGGPEKADAATMRAEALRAIQNIKTAWKDAAAAYFRRVDLRLLQQHVERLP